jgi:hypothetical protein
MSAARSTGSPTINRLGPPASHTAQMDENIKVGKEEFSIATVSDQLKSLLIFVSTYVIILVLLSALSIPVTIIEIAHYSPAHVT